MDITILATIGLTFIVGGCIFYALGKTGSTILLLLAGIAVIGCFIFVHSFQALSKQTFAATVHCGPLGPLEKFTTLSG
jgi:uncharacterized membrane protein (Fun14 family)